MTTARDQLLLDIFCTAIEGGINYWSETHEYHWLLADKTEDHRGFFASIVDLEGDSSKYLRVDRMVVSLGYGRARDANYHWSTEKPPLVITDDTDWDYDAGDADAIVQLGLFGEVVYG